MVMLTVPRVAVLLADSVIVLALVVRLGLNVAVTPLGTPKAARLTALLKPFSGLTVIMLVPLAPRATPRVLGAAESVKSPAGFTVRLNVVLPLRLPDVPVTVTVKVPIDAAPVAERVKRLVDAVGFVPKLALTPLGRPVAVKFTVVLNPFKGLIVRVVEPPAPWRKVKAAGDAERVKLGSGADEGQLFTKLVAFTVPIPVAKSQPIVVP